MVDHIPGETMARHAYRAGKAAATEVWMRDALERGEHAHLAGLDGLSGVNCPRACRRSGIKKWRPSDVH